MNTFNPPKKHQNATPRRRWGRERTREPIKRRGYNFIGTFAILITTFFECSTSAKTNFVVNTSSDPANVFECSLTATPMDVTIAGKTVHAMTYKDDAPVAVAPCPCDGIPILVMNLKVGQMVICHFKNSLPIATTPEGASIHWHGIELDNESDGTAVTQDALQEGQTYTYRFKVTRPGLFWFHSHMTPGNTTFAGMYGVILIPNNIEPTLVTANKLPPSNFTYTMALSDIEFNPTNSAPDYGKVGKLLDGVWTDINDLVNKCHQNPGNGNDACNAAGTPGKTVLLNGENPNTTPTTNDVPSGQRVRLHLLNEALSRHFRLKLLNAASNQISLYRIGGQGGLLNNPRLEGGVQGTRDTGFDPGEVAIGSGDRVDTIALLSGNEGDIIRLVGNPLKKPPGSTLPPTFALDKGLPVNYPVAFFRIRGVKPTPDPVPCTCDTILEGTSEQVPRLTGPTNSLTDGRPCPGTNNHVIRLTNAQTVNGQNKTEPAIDLSEGALEGNAGNGDFLTLPHPTTARYARVGDLLELSVRNETETVHPFHLHGFSLQPMRVLDNASGNTIYTYNYNEFVDTIDVYGGGLDAATNKTPGQTLVFRVRLEDRSKICDQATGPVLLPCGDGPLGGAVGRWLFHCHIFSHAGLGMMSELVVLDNSQETKWRQRPDLTPTGVDVMATASAGSKTVAEDFLCSSNGWITGVRIWGSWINDVVDANATFELKFWTDVPAFGGTPSRPGWQIWRRLYPAGTYTSSLEAFVFPNEAFYDPSQNNIIGFDTQVHRYGFAIPQCRETFDRLLPNTASGFYQHSGNIYWLSVTAYTTNGTFGWKTCVLNDRYNDDGSWSPTLIGPQWRELRYPSSHSFAQQSMGLAFELDNPATIAMPTNSPVPPIMSAPPLSVGLSGNQIIISWEVGGILQYADNITGPWTDLDGAARPYLTPADAPRRFYRVRMP